MELNLEKLPVLLVRACRLIYCVVGTVIIVVPMLLSVFTYFKVG